MKYQIFTANELYTHLYQNDYDKFIINLNDAKNRLKYFVIGNGYWWDDYYVCCIDNDKIVGVLNYAITKNEPTYQGHRHFISYISVDNNYQNKGIATELIKSWYETLFNPNKGICGASGFTTDGFNYLRNKLINLNVECEDSIKF